MGTFINEWNFNGVDYLLLGYYYPITWQHMPPLNEEEIKYNQMLTQFKQGFNQELILEKLANGLKEKFTYDELSSLILFPVPASNQIRHRRRYEEFCRLLCERTNLINGYSYLTIDSNNEPYHLGGKGFEPNKLSFNYDFKLKSVILLEDISKTGSTLAYIINEFKKKGAKKIYAIILGSAKQKLKSP